MSLSDFSLSSPRKSARKFGDKSITYDEEFEKFLNDTSESEFSTNKYAKKQNAAETPWWMKDDDDDENKFSKSKTFGSTGGGGTKSFMKQPKAAPTSSTKLTSTKESINEIDEETDGYKKDYSSKDKKLKFKETSAKYSDDFEPEQVQRLSLDNSTISSSQFESRQRKSYDYDYDRDKSHSRLNEEEEEEDEEDKVRVKYIDELDDVDDDKDSSEQASSSRKSQQSVIQRKPLEPETTMNKNITINNNDPNITNLLSKVMFMDSLDSGGIMGGSGTIDKNQLEAIQKQQELINKKNETKSSPNVDEIQVNNYGSKILNTQTRRDLADLERVYQNLAVTDSGLNTLIKTVNTSSNTNKDDKYEQTSSTEPKNDSSLIGLQTIRAITSELENRALEQILKEIEKNAPKKSGGKLTSRKSPRNYIVENMKPKVSKKMGDSEEKSGAWPPKKYEHIKGHGYGSSWSPAQLQKSYTMNYGRMNRSNENLNTQTGSRPILSRSNSSTRPIRRNMESNLHMNDSNYSSKASLSSSHNFDDEDKNNIVVRNLQSELIKCVTENESKIKEIRVSYEKQLNDLRAKIVNLTAELNEKNENGFKKIVFDEDKGARGVDRDSSEVQSLKQQIEVLKKSVEEQEILIKGYQYENEKLYDELKVFKQENHKEYSKNEEEKQQLKLDLIHEKLNHERERFKPSSILKKSHDEDTPNKFMPVMEESKPIEESIKGYEERLKELELRLKEADIKVNLLNETNKELLKRVDYYEKNQQQIEVDIQVIETKNKEIKRLQDKLKLLEMNKAAPECLKELKRCKNQLKEMDLLVKRMKKPTSTGFGVVSNKNDLKQQQIDSNSVINLSLDYYETRIEQLEAQVKEKTHDLERFNRMWEQKYFLYRQLYEEQAKQAEDKNKNGVKRSPTRKFVRFDSFNLDKKVDYIEKNYLVKLEQLENSNQQLRKLLDEFELRVDEKQKEIDLIKKSYEIEMDKLKKEVLFKEETLNKQKLGSFIQKEPYVKQYEPNEFKDNDFPKSQLNLDAEFIKNIYSEVESLKIKLANAQNELKLREKEHELKFSQFRHASDTKIKDLIQKHNYEINKLVSLLAGGEFDSNSIKQSEFMTSYNDTDSILDDPVRMRLLINSRDKYLKLNHTIDKQKEVIIKQNERINELKLYQEKCLFLNDINTKLNENINELRVELDDAKRHHTPEMKDFEALNNKLKLIEQKYAKRELEINSILNSNNKNGNEYENNGNSMRHLIHNSGSDGNNESLNNVVKHYEAQLRLKNKEIEKFRLELDNMLNLLKTLQR